MSYSQSHQYFHPEAPTKLSSNTQPDSRKVPSIGAEGPDMLSIPPEKSVKSISLWKMFVDTVTVDVSTKLLGWQILRRRKPIQRREIFMHSLVAIVPNIPCVSLWSYKRSTHNPAVVLCFQKLRHRLKYYPMLQYIAKLPFVSMGSGFYPMPFSSLLGTHVDLAKY